MNLDKIRTDTPFSRDKLFVNSAGASLTPKSVNHKIKEYLDQEEEHGGYYVEADREQQIEQFYSEAARLINTQPRNIAFTESATDAFVKALSSIDFKKDDVIVTSKNDYSSNQIQYLSLQRRLGVQVKMIKSLSNGQLDVDHFTQIIDEQKPRLVAVTHIPTNSGLIQDVHKIGSFCRDNDLIYLVDACQSMGQIEVDVEKIQCDFLSTTGRKWLRGPRGTGFLYVADRILERGDYPLYIDGYGGTWTTKESFNIHPGAKRFQLWESPYAMVVGFSEALRYLNKIGIKEVEKRNRELGSRLRENLSSLRKVTTYDLGEKKSNIITMRVEGMPQDKLQEHLMSNKVYHGLSTFEWGVIDFSEKGIDWAIRLSPHYFNTLDEMDQIAEIVGRL